MEPVAHCGLAWSYTPCQARGPTQLCILSRCLLHGPSLISSAPAGKLFYKATPCRLLLPRLGILPCAELSVLARVPGSLPAGFPPDDASDVLVRYHRSTAELLTEAAAWPCAMCLDIERFRAALGLLLQLVAAARAPPGPATGTAGGPSGPTPGAAHEPPAGGLFSAASSAARSAREVLLETSSHHAGELMCAGTARVAAVADALQAYLGWPPQMVARALLGCRTSPAGHALLGDGPAAQLAARCSPELLAAALTAVRPADCGSAASAGGGAGGCASPFGPASLPHASPARVAQVAAWLG